MDGTEEVKGGSKREQSTNEIREMVTPQQQTAEVGNLRITQSDEMLRGKLQRKEGEFTGNISITPRDEDWMNTEECVEVPVQETILSYREVLKPRNDDREGSQRKEQQEEIWDGNLLLNNEQELFKGVSVKDSVAGPIIEFSEEERRRLAKRWEFSLIIKLLGGTMGFMRMRRHIQTMWGKGGNVDLSDIGNGYMIATFQNIDDYYFAIEGGPWLIQNHYLTVQTWKPNFNPWNEKIQRVTVWVRLPGDYYDKKFFFHLGNKIGKAIKVDEMTYLRARRMYARMCVEIDLNAPLLPAYTVDGNRLKIEYEGLHMICFVCGKFGHDSTHCPSRIN
ncbi:uncharacterized protein LOC114712734 [Neltuma alba]|uniref:uncharacterized protein LOC114712734 n=1 Tax=Neltuma alba TaxID=207710 RepID=UPI0010A4C2CD|nr:uncharacterized protein LOC114712734 [Prosopis alba]